MNNIPEDFEDGLGDEAERYLSEYFEATSRQEDELPPQTAGVFPMAENNPIVETVGQEVSQNGFLGCLVLGAGILAAVEWFARNVGNRR